MGFDLQICLSLGICEDTGRPYYYTNVPGKGRVYDISDLVVPKEHRASFQQRGKHLHAYTQYFNEQGVFHTSMYSFLEQFPDWDQVMEYLSENDITYWAEQDHCDFYNALVWCEKSPYYFMVEWSY